MMPDFGMLSHWPIMILDQFDEAEKCYLESIRLDPKEPRWLVGLDITLRNLKRIEDARKVFDSALALDYQFAPSHFYLGKLEEEAGNTQAALASYQRALQANPGFLQAREAIDKIR